MTPFSSNWRWHLKKVARRGVAACGAVTRPLALTRPRVHALTYHRFADRPYDPFAVAPPIFESQMRWLRDRDLAVTLDQVEGYLEGRATLRDGSVLVTIDDGEPCLFERALPILSAYGIPAVAFVPVGELGAATASSATRRADRMDWGQLRELAAAGVTIGSHAWSHRSLGGRSLDEVREEAVRSRRTLEDALGKPVTVFAYPFGTRRDYDGEVAGVLRACGYRHAFTSQHGPLLPGLDPFQLPRVKIEGGDPDSLFQSACAGDLDGWRWIDRTLWRWQANTTADHSHVGESA